MIIFVVTTAAKDRPPSYCATGQAAREIARHYAKEGKPASVWSAELPAWNKENVVALLSDFESTAQLTELESYKGFGEVNKAGEFERVQVTRFEVLEAEG